ncbi:hypothetical protein [Clostridium ihumii]|uniref:hypothetical protein n=1 Tax=Clostridium ihumii TaxID=1470356 RepID=UPI00058B5271|nr:hypothetical protein [Clostridium ihumii]
MDSNNFQSFCNILKSLGVTNSNSQNINDIQIDPTAGASGNSCKYANLDIPCGFQDLDPMIITVVSEMVGNLLSGELPINVAGALGNWFQLIAQIIEMYIAQQQYSQSGPGRYYSPEYRNVSNPFCANPAQPDGLEEVAPRVKPKKNNKKKINNENNDKGMEELRKEVEILKEEVNMLKQQISILNNRNST